MYSKYCAIGCDPPPPHIIGESRALLLEMQSFTKPDLLVIKPLQNYIEECWVRRPGKDGMLKFQAFLLLKYFNFIGLKDHNRKKN